MAPDKTRRPGYAPAANPGVGRRGLHTRERILGCAAEVFLANGFHGSSLDTIAKAANASRATVYQYFAGKEDIFRELSMAAERDMTLHCERLGDLGPTPAGVAALHRWVVGWADIYDAHAAAFAEFPGIGTAAGLAVIDAGEYLEAFHLTLTERLRGAPLHGLDPHDAAAVLGRLPHMVNLYRHRAMFPLPDRSVTSASLTVAMQLMLFPDTPEASLRAVTGQPDVGSTKSDVAASAEPVSPEPLDVTLSPVALEIMTTSSALFAERGYYAVGMEDIAIAGEVSRATLYRYFGTKDRILAELTRHAVFEIEEQAATLARMATSLTEWMLRYVRFHRAYRGVIRAWFDGTVAEQLSDASVEHGIGAVHSAVRSLFDTVELPSGVHPLVAAAVFEAVLGRMSEPTEVPTPDSDERAADLMVTLLRRSLLRHAPAVS
jgi:AcrR family transcriptional regulator